MPTQRAEKRRKVACRARVFARREQLRTLDFNARVMRLVAVSSRGRPRSYELAFLFYPTPVLIRVCFNDIKTHTRADATLFALWITSSNLPLNESVVFYTVKNTFTRTGTRFNFCLLIRRVYLFVSYSRTGASFLLVFRLTHMVAVDWDFRLFGDFSSEQESSLASLEL